MIENKVSQLYMIELLLILFFSLLILYQIISTNLVEGFDTKDISLKNHDEIVMLKATLDTKYKPLIQNSEGKSTDLLTRLATLEGDVQALTQNAMDQQQNKVQSVPEAPDFTDT